MFPFFTDGVVVLESGPELNFFFSRFLASRDKC